MKSWFLLLSLVSIPARADEFHPLYRGARAQAMGNAFTAIADDEQAIFYNPAGLAGIDKFAFHILSSDIETSNDAISLYPEVSSSLGSQDASTLNILMGKNVYARAQETMTLLFPGFGITGIYTQEAAVRLKNTALPTGTVGRSNTYGAQAAFGIPIWKLKRKKKGELRFGVAAKMLFRSGKYTTPTLTQLLTLNYTQIMNAMNDTTGTGFGFDSGFQFVYHANKKVTLLSGLVYKDIGDTQFSGGGSIQKGDLTFGLGARFMSKDMIATLSFDNAHMLESVEWKKRTHFGLEMKFPLLSLYGGLNQFNLTYGAGLELWLVNFTYLSYAEEQATLVGIDPERRHMVHIVLKLDL